MSHFEVNIGRAYFFSVYFRPIKEWKRSNSVNQTMCFRGIHPEYKFGFRIIPNFTRYAISKEGEIWDTYLNELITNTYTSKQYITTWCYDPDRNKYRNLLVHRLVALAWVKNINPIEFCIVNHIDGNKHNPYYTNLEWCTHKKNCDHKYETGLSDQNFNCKVRDIETNGVTEFVSVRLACEYMGIMPQAFIDFKRYNSNKPINGKYELKLANDETPWKFDYILTNEKKVKAKITVIYPTGKLVTVYGFKELRRLLNIPETRVNFVERDAKRYARDNNIEITFEEIGAGKVAVKPIQVLDVSTGKIEDFATMRDAERALGIAFSTIQHCISKGEKFVTKGKAYRYKTDKKWSTDIGEAGNAAKCILGIAKNGRMQEFNSLREAEKITNINRATISKCLKGSTTTSNWYFKYNV